MDLKNINLNDIKLDDIKSKLVALSGDKKTLIKFGIAIGSIIVFLIIYYAILNPMVNKRKAKLDIMLTKKDEINKMEKEIIAAKSKIIKLNPEYKNYSTLFHSKEEVEGLYEVLSEFAGANGLVISKLSKGTPKAITKAIALAAVSKKKKKKAKKTKPGAAVAYYKIPVNFQIKGGFLGYIKFKRAISLSNKMLNFDKESIKVIKGGDSTNTIAVSGILTIVGLPNEFL